MANIRPGVNVSIAELPPSRSAPTDTGVGFAVGTSDKGPIGYVAIGSLSEFVTNFGARQTYSTLYDAMDVFFREGGKNAIVSRVVGPTPVLATKNLLDGAAAISLVVKAIGPGTYGNAFKAGVRAGTVSGYQVFITDAADVELESTPDLTTQQDAVDWSQNSAYVRITLGASALVPAVAAAATLASGTDDRANATDTQWADALALMVKDLGPGQVFAPGRTSTVGHTQLIAHAVANNRVALLDGVDSATTATHVTATGVARTDGRWGAYFAPWDRVAGITNNTTRAVPPSARIAGNIARNDIRRSVGQAAAGEWGQALFVNRLTQSWTDAQRQTLNNAGINVSLIKYGGVRTYGWRSLADPNIDPYWLNFGSARVVMAYTALGEAILEAHMFEEIDGQDRLFGRIEGQLIALANEFYSSGDLFGKTADEAFIIVCDDSNNTPTTIANRELHATAALRVSEFAEMIELKLVKVPVNQPVVQ